jgi:serine/threonine-protein kinase
VDRIGHYKIVSELGRGGMGVVYKAHEESLNRFVAIKMLGEHLEKDGEYVERFVREARSAAALSHPNIVQIYAIAEEDGHHYFVMEYVQGISVERMIHTQGKLASADAARLVLQAAAGLQDAHSQGVVHRDIKPANLMVTDRGLVKIADFGLALVGAATTRLTATGMLMGTPGYLSPEQCLDQGPDHRTDIYSLGVTFFEMVTGTMPFRADSPLALLKLIVEVEPPDIRELNPEVDDELRDIIARMLAKDREDRYPSCSEVIDDVRAWLEGRGEALHGVAVASGAAVGVMPPPPPPPSEEDINSHPTVVVESGSTEPAAGQQPPSPREVATAPAPQATAPATQPQPVRRRSGIGPIVAAAAVFVIGAGAAAAYLTVKSGILDGILKRGESRVEELDSAAEEPVADEDASLSGADSTTTVDESDSKARPVDADDGAGKGRTASGEPSSAVAGASSPEAGVGPEAPSALKSNADLRAGGEASRSGSSIAESAPEPKIVARPPTGTVVLAVGEQLFAVEAESYVKTRLERAGVEVIEVTSIPGLEGFVNTESRPNPEQLRDALRPFARYLVALRVEYLGDRVISYMGQRDTVYQARVNMGLVDLATGRRVGRPKTVKVEYTQLNPDEVAAKELRRAATSLVQFLPRE